MTAGTSLAKDLFPLSGRQKSSPNGELFCREALFAYSPAARRAAKSVRKALLRKAAETDVHAAGFGKIIGGLRALRYLLDFFRQFDSGKERFADSSANLARRGFRLLKKWRCRRHCLLPGF